MLFAWIAIDCATYLYADQCASYESFLFASNIINSNNIHDML